MARLKIEVWENDSALYDYRVEVNGEEIATGEFYTRERGALNAAYWAFDEWWVKR